jgi:2-oxo-4-hydroxy-4-carboxy-5-ureidoimidazoline decarboxylase
MNLVLARWNVLPEPEAAREILPCCGSQRWARGLARLRPFDGTAALFDRSDELFAQLDPSDWEEAFASHPRIGQKKVPESFTTKSAAWSNQEQSRVEQAGEAVKERLTHGNSEYERRFGRIYIVCATGKSAEEMLAILNRRLENDETAELREAAEQQRQITQLRLRKWLEP